MNQTALSIFFVLASFSPLATHADPLRAVETKFELVDNPPPLQVLLPGFTVRELPIELNNINNLVYAPDGRLFALGYNGNVYQLKDTDGDGLEETSTFFFKNDRDEILPSIGMCWGPGGLYIASRGRIIRLKDNGDGSSKLETIASGWVGPAVAAGSGLDAVGIAADAQGNIFFGLGCDNWQAAYRVNKETGKSEYNIKSDRGTIQKLSADGKTREPICTGVRFTVSLAFNAKGDLFASEQEGATWLPNGNPFDELLHIQSGRHYGFPPRHPVYLPNVIDEPSLFDYAPQHQSTCGLHFNEPVAGSTNIFGPAWWRGDALVSGESRGKIWHTKLVKSSAGYIARTDLIACLNMLTVDSVPTPDGDLLIACHSGQPDWGTGPQGKGKLFKISYTDKAQPQPLFTYAASPTELHVVFDRPIKPENLQNLVKDSRITVGEYVSAGDRFEGMWPGYQAVKDQRPVSRYQLPVLSASLSRDTRSIILQTPASREALHYAIKLPEGTQTNRPYDSAKHEMPQHASIDVATSLNGLTAHWENNSGKEKWAGWLPHLDLQTAREFTAVSEEHAALFKNLEKPGQLIMDAKLDLWQMLHPSVQPGATLDYEFPPETVTVVLKTDAKLKVESDRATVKRVNDREWHITSAPFKYMWVPLKITMATGKRKPVLEVTWFTNEDPRPRPLPLHRILQPWAVPPKSQPSQIASRDFPELAGGDWKRGKEIFFGEQAACMKCHRVGGEGGKIGPDLSNLTSRDYASVHRDIVEPSAAINPDHLAYNIELKNGEAITGIILEDTPEKLVVGQVSGESITLLKNQIVSRKASVISLMPEGLLKVLKPQQQKDLLTFLLTEPPKQAKK